MKIICPKCLHRSRRLRINTAPCNFCYGTNEVDSSLTYFFKKFFLALIATGLAVSLMLYNKFLLEGGLFKSMVLYFFLAALAAFLFSSYLVILREKLLGLYHE